MDVRDKQFLEKARPILEALAAAGDTHVDYTCHSVQQKSWCCNLAVSGFEEVSGFDENPIVRLVGLGMIERKGRPLAKYGTARLTQQGRAWLAGGQR